MAASVDASGSGTIIDDGVGSLSWTHVVNASAKLLVIFVYWQETNPSVNGSLISDIKVNGTSCTFNSQVVNGFVQESWYLNLPPTGTVTITVTWVDALTSGAISGNISANAGSTSFLSTNTTFPITRTVTKASDSSISEMTQHGGMIPYRKKLGFSAISSASTNNFLVDCFGVWNTTTTVPTITCDASQTQQWTQGNTSSVGFRYSFRTASSTRAALASPPRVIMQWTVDQYDNYAQTIVEVAGV